MIKKINIITIFLFLLNGCGFQNINSIYKNNLIIKKINITGQQSLIYLFKNELYDLKNGQGEAAKLSEQIKRAAALNDQFDDVHVFCEGKCTEAGGEIVGFKFKGF